MTQYLIDLDRHKNLPLYIQLYEQIKKEILTGKLEPGRKMPSIRALSLQLNISKNTVDTAYQQLLAEGYITSRPQSGYFAAAVENALYAARSNLADNEQSHATERQGCLYDFRSDHIDQESFNFSLWRRFINQALRNNKRFLNYGHYQGEPALRIEIARYLRQSRAVDCTPEQIVIGAGVQSLLHILCGLLGPLYHSIAFEDPGFKKAQYIFSDHQYTLLPIPLERDGLSIEALIQTKAKAVYVSPSHQFPLGAAMPVTKRSQLLKWAHDSGAVIIEDDYDSELRYFGRPIPSLQGMSSGSRVFYLGSFSKILIPSLRISYMVIPPEYLPVLQHTLPKYNQTSSAIEQIALAAFIKEGWLEKHIKRLRKLYAGKNQLMVDAIRSSMGDKVSVQGKESGISLLLEIKTGLTSAQLVELAAQAGIKVTPVSHYYLDASAGNFPQILLSYAGIRKEDIIPAITLLQQAWFAV
ncbi:MAG: PLP-dependent aminotransferase family protein [Clostridia bacterium]|nr:PLP-dependent aminotransferase family protein [Clostridia bacterium]